MSESHLNRLARSLHGGGHYSTFLGLWTLGNYDVSVAELALESQGYRIRWHDARAGAAGIDLSHGTVSACAAISVVGAC